MPVTTASPSVTPSPVAASTSTLTAQLCPRCDRHALHGTLCAHCGRVIITGLMITPCHPPAWSEGCCPVCFTTDPEVWEVHGRLLCTVCAEGHSRWGNRVKAAPGWRGSARRVLAWVDEPGSPSCATRYADEAGGR